MILLRIATFGAFFAGICAAHAHHSFVGFYDQERILEIEGRVKSVSWRNPHGSMTIEVPAADGGTTDWLIETGSISVLRVRGFDGTVVQVWNCFGCDLLSVVIDGQAVGGDDSEALRPVLLAAARAAFPDDEVLAELD